MDTFRSHLQKYHTRNSFWNTVDACFFQVAFTCSIPTVIIVAFLKHYTDSQLILNLPVFIGSFTMSLIPFLMSFLSGGMRRKKRAVVVLGSTQRFLWGIVAAAALFFSDRTGVLLPLFFTGYILYQLFSSAVFLFWQELLGRALLPEKMSSAMGTRESVSRLFGFLASLLAAFILGKYAFPRNFIILFLITFIGNLGSIFSHCMIKEAPYEKVVTRKPAEHVRNMLRLPVKDRTFLWFAVFSIFASGNLFIGGLYTSVGIERFKGVIDQDTLA